jgi:hypothetical protein
LSTNLAKFDPIFEENWKNKNYFIKITRECNCWLPKTIDPFGNGSDT